MASLITVNTTATTSEPEATLEVMLDSNNTTATTSETGTKGETKESQQITSSSSFTKPLSKSRHVFISCSSLSRCWQKVPKDVLSSSIFLFGSKYSWVFPKTKEELKDAKRQPGRYHQMDKDFLDLVQQKYDKGEVYFLKSEELEYKYYPGPPDLKAYTRLSEWLVEKHNLPPLILSNQKWNSLFKNKEQVEKMKYCKKKDRIIKNYTGGFHEYNELLQLLDTSFGDKIIPKLIW